jgi:hypothetical protein
MKMNEKRLIWDELKSNVVFCYNKKKEQLGYLEYEIVGSHMHWCWYQFIDIRMSPGCLQEVRDKQKELLNLIKNKSTPNKY